MQRNIKDFLIKAKVYGNKTKNERRILPGMRKCNKPCVTCPYILEGKLIKSENYTWNIKSKLNCDSRNIIYMIQCNIDTCKQQYIGESHRSLKYRISEHRGYINNHKYTQATGYHFNMPGHNLSNMSVTIIEQVKKNDMMYRKERESYFIRKFNTLYNGMNRAP